MMAAPEKRFNALDEAMLDQLRRVWSLLDPPPADLDPRVAFVVELADLDIEVAHLETQVDSSARATGQTRTVAFSCPSLSLMVSVTGVDGGVRLDGWHAPARRLRVELRTAQRDRGERRVSYAVESDESGRFAFADVPHGVGQLVLHDAADTGRSVVSPSIRL